MRFVLHSRILFCGLVLGAGLAHPPEATAVLGGLADSLCESPADAQADLTAELSGTDTSSFGGKACARYCKNLHKTCWGVAKTRAACHKAAIKRDAASERIVCSLEEDKEFRADCNQFVREDVRDCTASLKDDTTAAKDDCAAFQETCLTDCAAGTLFPGP